MLLSIQVETSLRAPQLGATKQLCELQNTRKLEYIESACLCRNTVLICIFVPMLENIVYGCRTWMIGVWIERKNCFKNHPAARLWIWNWRDKSVDYLIGLTAVNEVINKMTNPIILFYCLLPQQNKHTPGQMWEMQFMLTTRNNGILSHNF